MNVIAYLGELAAMGLKNVVLLPVAVLVMLTACTGIIEQEQAYPHVGETVDAATAVSEPNITSPPASTTELVTPAPTATTPANPTAPQETAETLPAAPADIQDLSLSIENVQLYPVPKIYAGDRVTFQIQPRVPENVNVNDVTISIYVDGANIVTDILSHRNWAGEAEGLFEWAWNTTGQIGPHEIRAILDPNDVIQIGDESVENNEVVFNVDIGNPRKLPKSIANTSWAMEESDCCHIFTLTGTAAYRDRYQLIEAAETAVTQAADKLDELPERKLNIYFIDRTIGQGGYAGSDMVVTYNDRSYAGGNLHELLVHEAVHILDRQFAPQRLKFLAEGVAVWASGGHYKTENLNERSAALLQLGQYIPLQTLLADFYPTQHEIGYLEAAGFVTYLIDRYGWSTFRDFYIETSIDDAPVEAEALDLNMRAIYGKSLAEMESEWLGFLQTLELPETAVTDLATSIRYYDTMRRYQQAYDPAAHFLTAWLPSPREVREAGNPTDYLYHSQLDTQVTLEVILQAADEALRAGNYPRAIAHLDSINRILDTNTFVDPLATSYFEIVQKAMGIGYEVQDVSLKADSALVLVKTANKPTLNPLQFKLKPLGWVLTN